MLLGCGLVGKAVLRQLLALNGSHPSLRFVVKAVAESDVSILRAADGGAVDIASLVEFKSGEGARLKDYTGAGVTKLPSADLLGSILGLPDIKGKRGVMIDCTASAGTAAIMQPWVEAGGVAVMANKKPLTGPLADFRALVSPAFRGSVGYESAVGAGTPFVAAIRRLVGAGDEITKVEGTFSGTMGYLMAGLQTGEKKWSELVAEAHGLGYTEPDPRDDLSGTDVARKALIIARTLGWDFEMSDIDIEPCYPESLASVSVDAFKAGIAGEDEAYAAKRAEAAKAGKVLRYVATVTKEGLAVKLLPVAVDSALGMLRGSDNMMTVTSKAYPTSPLVVQGAGAGDHITAIGVVADMVQILESGATR